MFECHITIDPVAEDIRKNIETLANAYRFKLAKLLMQNGQPSHIDTFMTSHDDFKEALECRMVALCLDLKEKGFKIRRYKIEAIILDSRDKDIYDLLGEANAQRT